MNELTKRERTIRQLILALLDDQKKTQQILADEIGERQDYISPIIKQLEKEEIIKRELGTSPKTYTDRTSADKVTKDYAVKFCYLSPSLNTFKLLAKEFLTSEDRLEFIKSKHAQSTLTDKFLDTQMKKVLEMFEHRIPQDFVLMVKLLTPEIFRRFPLALYYLLFPEEIEKELSPLQQFLSKKEKEFSGFEDMFAEQLLTPEGIRILIKLYDNQIKRAQEMIPKFEKRKQMLIKMQKKVEKEKVEVHNANNL